VDRRLEIALLGGERRDGRVEVRDEVLELALVAGQAGGRAPEAADQAAEVLVGLDAEERLVDDRLRLGGRPGVVVRVVERLGGGLAARGRVGVAVLGGVRLALQRGPEAVEHVAQVLARVALERGEHLVELDRRRGLGQLERAAVVELRGAGRAGLEVDEEVALEEDARPDLGAGVGADRAALVGDLHRHDGVVRAVLRVDLLDLADVDAGDAHRRVGPQAVGGLEHGVDLVAARERDVLREAEVREHQDRDDRDQADRERAAALAAPAGCAGWAHRAVLSVLGCWVPGAVPTTVSPRTKGSLPASHSFGWPGAAVFGYGLECRWFSRFGPFAGAEASEPSLFGPCGVATMMNRCQVPFTSPSESSEPMLRKNSET
jgi:hypothetical protein